MEFTNSSIKSSNEERRELWASQLLSMIRMKLNPCLHGGIRGGTAAKKMYITTLFSKEDFLLLFPSAVKHEVAKKPQKKTGKRERVPEEVRKKFYVNGKLPEGFGLRLPKSTTTKKLYSQKFRNLRDLDYLFGEDWDLYYHHKDVGYVLPVFEVRLIETIILSYKTRMSNTHDAKVVTFAEGKTHTTLSITLNRGCISRLTPFSTVEKDWLPEVRLMQSTYEETQRRRVQFYTRRGAVIPSSK